MRLDSLVRLLESADFVSFREIAAIVLARRGFRDVALTDGWRDGGRDFRVATLPPNPLKLGVQVSVERDWKGKLAEDARKVRDSHGLSDLLFVSSRRLADAEFSGVSDSILKSESVRVTKMDSQGIATLAITEGFADQLLRALGISTTVPTPRSISAAALREDVAYSFAFFGNEPTTFRKEVVEQSIVSALYYTAGSGTRDDVVANVSGALALADNQKQQVRGGIDRMLQDGRLIPHNDEVQLRTDLLDGHGAAVALRENDWNELGEAVRACLTKRTSRRNVTDDEVRSVLEPIGALLLSAGAGAAAAIESPVSQSKLRTQLRDRMRLLHASLEGCGVSGAEALAALLEELTQVAMQSSIGRHLVAGELFLALASMQTPHLLQALGSKEQISVLIDSSVAIPMLTGLLFETTDRFDSLASRQAFEQIQAHGINAIIPWDYLEETAAHMLDAFLAYGAIVDLDPDLRASENAFVSHYVTLRIRNKLGGRSFLQYLQAFGFDERLALGNYYAARDEYMRRISSIFQQYGISTRRLHSPSRGAEKRAQEAVSFAEHERSIRRQRIVASHDIRTIAFLYDRERNGGETYILCTWDNLHFYVREHHSSPFERWLVLDPALLGDVLSLAAAEELPVVVSPTVLAMSMSDGAAKSAAHVWDVLVNLERGNLYDADLLAQARAFKASYSSIASASAVANGVRDAWQRWKSTHAKVENE